MENCSGRAAGFLTGGEALSKEIPYFVEHRQYLAEHKEYFAEHRQYVADEIEDLSKEVGYLREAKVGMLKQAVNISKAKVCVLEPIENSSKATVDFAIEVVVDLYQANIGYPKEAVDASKVPGNSREDVVYLVDRETRRDGDGNRKEQEECRDTEC